MRDDQFLCLGVTVDGQREDVRDVDVVERVVHRCRKVGHDG